MLDTSTRLGRMLEAGRLTATVTSKRTGHHVTVTFKSWRRGERNVSLADASMTFVSEQTGGYGAPRVGTIRDGRLSIERDADQFHAYAARVVWQAATTGVLETDAYTIRESDQCGRCGLPLTDPVSIDRGLGPDCAGKVTGSTYAGHAVATSAAAPAVDYSDCLDHDEHCSGAVEYRMPLTGTGRSFVRCDRHWNERLDWQAEHDRKYPDSPLAPAWFDPAYAGERWDEE